MTDLLEAKIKVKIHGSFNRQAAIEFDEFNSECEQFSFIGNLAIPPKKFEFKERKLNVEISSREYQTKAKVFNVENQAKSTANKKEKREVWIEKAKKLMHANDDSFDKGENSIHARMDECKRNRKVSYRKKLCFTSPKNKTCYFDTKTGPSKQIMMEDAMDIDNDSIQKIPAPPIKSIQSKICKEKEDFNAEKEDLQV
ncbi:hypothetical protein E5676_scaffold349G00750 [Cucumis melo var. makuwa]|uniref:Uncharacterized protein n=1 Tax=Cucumis melo var. makuwa TaxID=1194695 RepID=A0A5D3E3I9_CUCMM|nr:hypothetical protein E5676_scaffold349G00750 [Cucumis melo var. makuwa]